MQPRYLLGIDPGKATGVCLIDLTDSVNPKPVWSYEWSVNEFYTMIEPVIATDGVELFIACEDFRITAATAKLTEAPWSLNLIGVVQFLGLKYNRKVSLQLPSEKPFATNDRLRMVGFWHKGGEGHANDAYRHAMIWLVKNNREWTKNLLL